MKKIGILTQSHLCRNPRVVKEANTLAAAGYDVHILTTFTSAELLQEDLTLIDPRVKLEAAVNMIPGQSSKFYRFYYRLRRRVAGEMIARFRKESPHALGYDYHRNIRKATALKADLYICHQEVSTVIGCRMICFGFKVAFDFEDWYSHDLLPAANRTRPLKLLAETEQYALRHGVLSYTTSHALAEQLAAFASSQKPGVLYNVFPFAERNQLDGLYKDRKSLEKPSIHWYSQTIGPGRGLEFLVDALSSIDTPVEIHLRGNLFGSFKDELMALFPHSKGHQLFFHPLVSHQELLSRIAEHDIGLAMEEPTPDSRNLTITNKILQYLQAGIAVIASDTAGQQEVAAQAGDSVFIYQNYKREDFVARLNELLADTEKVSRAKLQATKLAEEQLCWEKEQKRLLAWIQQVLKE